MVDLYFHLLTSFKMSKYSGYLCILKKRTGEASFADGIIDDKNTNFNKNTFWWKNVRLFKYLSVD